MPERRRLVRIYEYGESYDDLQAAFFIDEWAYDNAEIARSAVDAADAAMNRAGVIYEVEVTSGVDATRPSGVPTWEEFKQRHFIDGVPLPVRARRHTRRPHPSWTAMVKAVEAAHRDFRDELVHLLTEALPGRAVSISSDPGPSRRSPGSVDWSEESFGFEVMITAALGDLPPLEALDIVSAALQRQGWQLDDRDVRPASVVVQGSRGVFTVGVDARQRRLTLFGQSPLYRAPAVDFVIEAR